MRRAIFALILLIAGGAAGFLAWMRFLGPVEVEVATEERNVEVRLFGIGSVEADAGYRDVLSEPEHFIEQCGDEVKAAFRRLSTAERSCLMLRAIEKFSYKEIAETLDMPVGTVMTHLSRGRAKLRADLLEYGKERGIVRAFPRLMPREENDEREGMAAS